MYLHDYIDLTSIIKQHDIEEKTNKKNSTIWPRELQKKKNSPDGTVNVPTRSSANNMQRYLESRHFDIATSNCAVPAT